MAGGGEAQGASLALGGPGGRAGGLSGLGDMSSSPSHRQFWNLVKFRGMFVGPFDVVLTALHREGCTNL